jgi:hypothetical protein
MKHSTMSVVYISSNGMSTYCTFAGLPVRPASDCRRATRCCSSVSRVTSTVATPPPPRSAGRYSVTDHCPTRFRVSAGQRASSDNDSDRNSWSRSRRSSSSGGGGGGGGSWKSTSRQQQQRRRRRRRQLEKHQKAAVVAAAAVAAAGGATGAAAKAEKTLRRQQQQRQ